MGVCERLRKIRRSVNRRLIKSYVALFISLFSSSFAITMMFPFAPFLVKFLLPQVKETDVGNYVGMLAGAMFFGRFLASYGWGIAADHKGRKPVIITSLLLLGASSAVFGFSVHFAMAIVARFLVGITNGVVGTVKAVVSELSDDSTQALGVSIISTSWGLGFIVGPAVSGAISDPIGQYNLNITNSVVHTFLTKFPYSLPCLLNTLLCLTAALVTFLLLPETKGMKKNRRRSEINQTELSSVAVHQERDEGYGEEEGEGEGERGKKEDSKNHTTCADGSEDGDMDEVQRSLLGNNKDDNAVDEEQCHGRRGKEHHGRKESDRDDTSVPKRTVLHTYSVFISNIGSSETERANSTISSPSVPDTVHSSSDGRHCRFSVKNEAVTIEDTSTAVAECGGSCDRGGRMEETESANEEVNVSRRTKVKVALKATLMDLKLFLCSRGSSISLFIYCIFSFGVIGMDEVYSLWAFTSAHHGGLGFALYEIGISLSVAGTLMVPTCLFLFPMLERYLGLINSFYISVSVCMVVAILMPNLHYLIPYGLTWLLWVMLCGMKYVFMVFVSAAFASTILFINNSVTFDKLGAINGLSVSMTAITRTIAPMFSGSVFAGSLSSATLAIGFPFNYNLIFVIFGLVFLSTVVMATCLPSTINKQKIIEDVEESVSETSSEVMGSELVTQTKTDVIVNGSSQSAVEGSKT